MLVVVRVVVTIYAVVYGGAVVSDVALMVLYLCHKLSIQQGPIPE